MNGESRKPFDYRTVAILVGTMIASTAVQWGVFTGKLEEHGRRLEKIEKILEERSITREEYERRHVELLEQVREQEKRIRDLEKARK